eukprot:TRINITY_DN4455_c0_g1_i1.p1 TRINITY_DN4455_c0_g1~~TRINITY_DN4455_c0_g1_i1.p1  ORF type:complete len:1644 (+),score=583.26 TRINITY_DN4455_c0_g1_i1:149-5080(+)
MRVSASSHPPPVPSGSTTPRRAPTPLRSRSPAAPRSARNFGTAAYRNDVGDSTRSSTPPTSAGSRVPPRRLTGVSSAGTNAGSQAAVSENIVAAVRVRSFLQRELDRGDEMCIKMYCNTTKITCPRGRVREDKPFTFDHCFWSVSDLDSTVGEAAYASQEDVYSTLGVPVVENALKGFNSAIIAYGQTGSGKSYSIFGPPGMAQEPQLEGLIPRVCKELFARMQTPPKGTTYKVTASMIEIYMEKVYDLLNNRNQLTIRGDLQHGFSVPGRVRPSVKTYEKVARLLQLGDDKKTTAQTALNERSSRAHTMFELEIKAITELKTTTSKVTLCDLAGSERCKDAKTEAGGREFNQACQINMSLLCLGKCVLGVAKRGGRPDALVTEFRNSALTKLLKDSIGGNSKTVLLTTISPSMHDAHTTMQALRFANRAKEIQNHAVINEDTLWEAKIKASLMQQIYQQRLDALTREFELEKQQAELQERQLRLQSECARLQAEKDTIEGQKQHLLRSREASDADRRRLEEREQDLQERLQRVHAEHEQLRERAEELEDQNDMHYATSQDAKMKKEELEEEVRFLQARIDLINSDYEEASAQWEEEKQDMEQSHMRALQNARSEHALEVDRLNQRSSEEKRTCVQKLMAVVEKVQNDAEQAAEHAKERQRSWDREREECKCTVQAMSCEGERMQREVQELKLRLGEAEMKSSTQGSQLAAALAELRSRTKESELLQDRLTTACYGQTEVSDRNAVLIKDLARNASEADRLREEHEAARHLIEQIRRQALLFTDHRRRQNTKLASALAELKLEAGKDLLHSGVRFRESSLVVATVDGPAAAAGIKPDMALLSVGGVAVTSVEHVKELLCEPDEDSVLLQFADDATIRVPVPVGCTLADVGVTLSSDGTVLRSEGVAREHGLQPGATILSEPVEGDDSDAVFQPAPVHVRMQLGRSLQSIGVAVEPCGTVVEVAGSGAAERAGVRTGMRLVSVGERDVAEECGVGGVHNLLTAPLPAHSVVVFEPPDAVRSADGECGEVAVRVRRGAPIESVGVHLVSGELVVESSESIAAEKGVEPAMVLSRVDGRRVSCPEDAKALLARPLVAAFAPKEVCESHVDAESDADPVAGRSLADMVGMLGADLHAEREAHTEALRAECKEAVEASAKQRELDAKEHAASVADLKEAHSAIVSQLEEEKRALQHKVNALESAVSHRKDELVQSQAMLAEVEECAEQRERELRGELAAGTSQVSSHRERAAAAQREAEAALQRCEDQMLEDREHAAERMRELESQLEDHQREVQTLGEQLQVQQRDQLALRSELDEANDKVEEMEEEISQKVEEVAVVERQAERLEANNVSATAQLREEIQEAEQERAELVAKHQASIAERDEAVRDAEQRTEEQAEKVREATAAADAALEARTAADRSVSELEKEKAELEASNRDLAEQLEAKKAEMESLRAQQKMREGSLRSTAMKLQEQERAVRKKLEDERRRRKRAQTELKSSRDREVITASHTKEMFDQMLGRYVADSERLQRKLEENQAESQRRRKDVEQRFAETCSNLSMFGRDTLSAPRESLSHIPGGTPPMSPTGAPSALSGGGSPMSDGSTPSPRSPGLYVLGTPTQPPKEGAGPPALDTDDALESTTATDAAPPRV